MCVAPPRGGTSFPGEGKINKKTQPKRLHKDTAQTECMGDENFTGIENDFKPYRSLLVDGESEIPDASGIGWNRTTHRQTRS